MALKSPGKGKKGSGRSLGSLGEELAARYLAERGYTILERNYRCPYGELDLIAVKADWLVFVEVRARRSLALGMPEESLTPIKEQRLKQTALHYISMHPRLPRNWRFDVIALEIGPDGEIARLEHIENAFS